MIKSELVEFIAEQCDIPKSVAQRAADAFLAGVTHGLQTDGNVKLVGFGQFKAAMTKQRPGRNPRTGETLTVEPRMRVTFYEGVDLKGAVNEH